MTKYTIHAVGNGENPPVYQIFKGLRLIAEAFELKIANAIVEMLTQNAGLDD